jgi:serine/threonine protein kinase
VSRLKELHEIGFIHNDLKPANILVESKSGTVSIIDYGMASSYIKKNGNHRISCDIDRVGGTPQYFSVNACKFESKSRRDDMESLIYILYEMLGMELPWRDCD